jgi:predicted amidophosphoribosyltransferase
MGHVLAYEGLARQVLHLWKFGGAWYLSEPLADKLLSRLKELPSEFDGAPLTFIPPHPWRLLRKDFHPPLLLARALGRRTGRPVLPLLVKRSLRRPQSSLSRERRLKNVRGTFSVRRGVGPPEAAILVDDVATTGATLAEAARVLARAGVGSLAAFTLARTP